MSAPVFALIELPLITTGDPNCAVIAAANGGFALLPRNVLSIKVPGVFGPRTTAPKPPLPSNIIEVAVTDRPGSAPLTQIAPARAPVSLMPLMFNDDGSPGSPSPIPKILEPLTVRR